MRKDGGVSAPASLGKMFACFETKPFFATLLAFTLIMLVWNLQPYYESLLSSTTAARCAAGALTQAPPEPQLKAVKPLSPEKPNATAAYGKLAADGARTARKAAAAVDPNKRTFQAYGSAAALFVQMGAYRGGPRTFAVVGLASKPTHVFGKPWYKCEWVPTNSTQPPVRAKAYKMLPDWGYGRVYTVVVVNCTFPTNPNSDNGGGKLLLYAYYGESPRRYKKFAVLDESPGSYDESQYYPPYKYEYLYCGSSLYGNLSAPRIREWMAYHAWFFGPSSHFVLHDAGGVSPEVRAVLEPWIRAGRVTLQDVRAQSEYDGYYYNQFLMVNDCLHRYRHHANWTFFFDVDEYLYLPGGKDTLGSVMRDFSGYAQFTIEQNAVSSVLCIDDRRDRSREWGFEKMVFRDSRTRIRRDRKYAIQARNAYATGVHMSENVAGRSLHRTEKRIRYYHYHNTITVHEELCRRLLPETARASTAWVDKVPYVYDDSMKKLAPTVKEFERSVIGAVSQ